MCGAQRQVRGPARTATTQVCLQVWLCHHAQVTQQDNSRQTMGAALDQELPVWGALAADAPQLPLTGAPKPCK